MADNDLASQPVSAAAIEESNHQPTIPSTTGPVGETGLPPSRPSSNATNSVSRAGARSAAPPPRVASPVPSLSGGRSSHQNDSSRRTHVPNLISSAFFPNSPRSPPPTSPQQPQIPIARPSTDSGRRTHRSRNSNASIVTLDQSHRPRIDPDAPPLPTSRGTGTTAVDTNRGSGLDNNRELHPFDSSMTQESHSPLQKPRALELDTKPLSASSLQAQKSPISQRSLRPSWSRQSRSSRGNARSSDREGHEKLPSVPPSPAPRIPDPVNPGVQQDLGKNYEYFNGNTVFFLRGRLINSRQRPLNVFTALLTIIPAALFFAFSAPWLWHHVSPAIPILFAYVFFICISSYLHASFTEPGIIPRNLHPQPPTPADEDPLAIGPATTEWVTVRSFAPSNDGNATAMEVPIKFCKSCNIWRPPRAHHCRVCDSCIETQDHHCVWLNNCVGRRNYRYFLTFVASGTVLGFFLFGASLAHILVWMVRNNSDFAHALNVWRVPAAMCVFALLIIPYPMSLWGYHLFLMGRGETTREYLNSHKFLKKDRHRPFSQHSILRNWLSIVMRPRPPTYMRFKYPYLDGDQRLGGRKSNKSSKTETDGVEMREMKGENAGHSAGFQGPSGRGPINSTPRL